MASCVFLSFLTLTTFLTLSSASRHLAESPAASATLIQQACKATRFPDICASSLSQFPGVSEPIQTIGLAIHVSYQDLKAAQKMVTEIKNDSVGNLNRTTAANNCLEVLNNSDYRTTSAYTELTRRRSTRSARSALSAALLYQYDCWSALKYANDTQAVNSTMSFLNTLTIKSSNALSMLFSYHNFGNDTARWAPPKTERDGLWERAAGSELPGFPTAVPRDLKADVTVCKSGCRYATVQAAVDAAPAGLDGEKRFVILIKAGVYEETVRVSLDKRNVVFLGEGMGKTIITGSLNVGQPGITTYNTATVGILGDGFMASGLTIQNTAGPDAHQAVAFRSDSDLSVIENCEFLGHQDTLYAHGNRQLYKSCKIQGTVDFIFGNSAAVFLDCSILVAPRQLNPEKGEKNTVTAHGRTDPAQLTGFVFQNCSINGTEEYMKLYHRNPKVHETYLGRPWKEYSRTVFINCNMEALVMPQGWMPWDGDFALNTLFYGEYGNTGPGSVFSQRVNWTSTIPAEHVSSYSVKNFLQ